MKKDKKIGVVNIHADALSSMYTRIEASLKCFNCTGAIFVRTEKSDFTAGHNCVVKEFEVSNIEQFFTTRPCMEWC